MRVWKIYDKNGTEKCETKKLVYSGEFMGACSVSVTISSPIAIDFELGDWLEYREERFVLNYDPSVVKSASSGIDGEGFMYENVVFNSLSDELTRCDFLDSVKGDNGLHYFALPTFSFFADSVSKLAERIQANLDRVYKGDKKWTVVVADGFEGESNINVSASNNTVWDALGFVNTLFKANFVIRGRRITIGSAGVNVGNQLFSYGKGNGLYKIEKNADSNQKIVTRLRAYGSTRNMPLDYYLNLEGGNVPPNLAVKNLMLPSFPTNPDPYIESENISRLGVREGTVFFDGSNEMEEIYPSMEGMTAEELKAAGIPVNAEGALDEVLSAEQIEDDGKGKTEDEEVDSEDIKKTFQLELKDIGFDINDYLSAENASISMKSGMCGGREFVIEKCEKSETGYTLTCTRFYDEGINLYFPYKDYQIKAGDKFVLLNIEMPDVYIKAAAQKLEAAATAYLAKNDSVRYSYALTVDNLFMARQHDESVKRGVRSIYDLIKEGDLMPFRDDDLGINDRITIASLTIKEDLENSLVPEYEITLQDEKSMGTIEKIQNQLTNLAIHGGGNGNVNEEQVKGIIENIGKSLFLSKNKDDRSRGLIASDKGFDVGVFESGQLGTGGTFRMSGNGSYMEVDELFVRKLATFIELSIQKMKHVGGSIILTKASMKCHLVIKQKDCYRCYFLARHNGESIPNEFEVGDLARSQTFKASEGVNQNIRSQYYWRRVSGVSSEPIYVGDGELCHYIELSISDCDGGSGEPRAGDEIIQLGNRTNTDRQSAIILSTVGDDAPSFKQYVGIKSYNTDEATIVTKLSLKENIISSMTKMENGETLAETLESIRVNWDSVLEQTDKEFTMWFYAHTPSSFVEPEINWDTPELKELHEEDLFYCTNNSDEENYGKVWRYTWDEESHGHIWKPVTDAATIAAMEKAINAQNLADSKVKCYVLPQGECPTPPYSEGDIWLKAYYKFENSNEWLYEDDNLVCVTPKKEDGAEFDISDWQPSSYTTTAKIKTTEKGVEIVNKAFELDKNNDLVVKQESGLVTTSTFSGLFASAVTNQGVAKKAELSAYVSKDKEGNIESGVKISADNVDINGIVKVYGQNSVTIGGYTVDETNLSAYTKSTETNIPNHSITITPDAIEMIQGGEGEIMKSRSGIRHSTEYLKAPGFLYSIIEAGNFDGISSIVGNAAGYFRTDVPNSFALTSIGNVYMASNDYGGVSVGGFSLINRDSASKPTIDKWGGLLSDFIIINDGQTLTLPTPNLCSGKVVFVKKIGGTLSVQNFVGAKSGDVVAMETDFDDRPYIFISSGNKWYEFYCCWD